MIHVKLESAQSSKSGGQARLLRSLIVFLLISLPGCSHIPTWTTKGWVEAKIDTVLKERKLEEKIDTTTARSIADAIVTKTALPRDVPPGTVLAWIPPTRTTPIPDGWVPLHEYLAQEDADSLNYVYLRGLTDLADKSIGRLGGEFRHGHGDTVSGPLYEEGNISESGKYIIAPDKGGHKHEVKLSHASNDPRHVNVIFIVRKVKEEEE